MKSRQRRAERRAQERQARNARRREVLNLERSRKGLPPLAERQTP